MERLAYDMLENKKVHVPCSIITLAIGLYLAIVCLMPSFNPACYEIVTHGATFIFIPYILFILIGSPLFSLFYYYILDKDSYEYVESCCNEDIKPICVPVRETIRKRKD